MDSPDCLDLCTTVNALAQLPLDENQALVWIKPHAVTEKTKALVKNSFAEPADAGFTVVREGSVSVDGGEAYFYDLRWD